MKILASLALAVSLSANAAGNDQNVCAHFAEIGRSAAHANAKGVSEWGALRAWQNLADSATGRASDAVFAMGVLEIRAVYKNGDVDEGVGYWTAYNACMGAT
jgi:hypothetical protein